MFSRKLPLSSQKLQPRLLLNSNLSSQLKRRSEESDVITETEITGKIEIDHTEAEATTEETIGTEEKVREKDANTNPNSSRRREEKSKLKTVTIQSPLKKFVSSEGTRSKSLKMMVSS